MKKLLSLILAVPALMLVSCKEAPVSELKDGSVLDYSFEFFRQTCQEASSNIVVSPYSAGVALSMLQDGASGRTLEEINKVLNGISYAGTSLSTDSLAKVVSSNSIWLRKDSSIKEDYRRQMISRYDAEVSSLDFSLPDSKDVINGWCKDKTGGLIPSIVDRLDNNTVLLLLNALYFKAGWDCFEESRTSDDVFHGTAGNAEVPFMKTSGFYLYGEYQGAQLVTLPYKSRDYSFQVLLPAETSSPEEVMNYLSEENYRTAMESCTSRKVNLELPKFKFESSLNLNAALKAMGMDTAFSKADLDKITEASVKVDEVVQKCYLDVSEKGTEAAAVTGIKVSLTSVRPGPAPVWMKVDRPFLFLVKDNRSDQILFIGKVVSL